MNSQDRFVGVASPPQGVDPEPPRLVVDLSKGLPTKSLDLIIESVQVGQTSDSTEPIMLRAVGKASAPEPARPPRYASFSEHRKRLRRAVVRRWELTVWCAAGLVAISMATVLLAGGPGGTSVVSAGAVGLSALPGPPSDAAPGPSGSGHCFLSPCDRPVLSGPPTLLRIPAIGVSTTLESLVVNSSRQLEPPTDYAKAGWWTQGVVPGDVGAAVFAGHVDSAKSGPAIFYKLNELKPGDTVLVDRGGQTVTFSVTEVERYAKTAFPTGRVYQPTPDAELRLITCGGEFDRKLRSYRDNIVVYAVLA